jgi:uncharacterized protein YcgI (DUF1989 family)
MDHITRDDRSASDVQAPQLQQSGGWVIPPKSGHALTVQKGQILRVIDLEGSQACDLVCFNLTDHLETLSPARTRLWHWRVRISTGDQLISNRHRPMFTIVEDTVGIHDLLLASCNRRLYEEHFKVGSRDGCFELLASALASYGVTADQIPDPFNLFTNTAVENERDMVIRLPVSKRGDHTDLRAEMDLLVGMTSCPEDISDCNGGVCTPIEFQIIGG